MGYSTEWPTRNKHGYSFMILHFLLFKPNSAEKQVKYNQFWLPGSKIRQLFEFYFGLLNSRGFFVVVVFTPLHIFSDF